MDFCERKEIWWEGEKGCSCQHVYVKGWEKNMYHASLFCRVWQEWWWVCWEERDRKSWGERES